MSVIRFSVPYNSLMFALRTLVCFTDIQWPNWRVASSRASLCARFDACGARELAAARARRVHCESDCNADEAARFALSRQLVSSACGGLLTAEAGELASWATRSPATPTSSTASGSSGGRPERAFSSSSGFTICLQISQCTG